MPLSMDPKPFGYVQLFSEFLPSFLCSFLPSFLPSFLLSFLFFLSFLFLFLVQKILQAGLVLFLPQLWNQQLLKEFLIPFCGEECLEVKIWAVHSLSLHIAVLRPSQLDCAREKMHTPHLHLYLLLHLSLHI
jgi:hypothetical protein